MIMQEVVGHCIWKKVSCNYLRNNGFYISYLRAQYFLLYCLILAIAKYPFDYILWCHIWRHFYPLRLLLILLGWLHQVVDHLYLGLSPTKFKSTVNDTKTKLELVPPTLIRSTAFWLPSCLPLTLSSCSSTLISSMMISRSSPSSFL